MPQISLFASSVRPHLWDAMFKSLEGTSVEVEIVFAGNIQESCNWRQHSIILTEFQLENNYKYIHTNNIKPAQCYEVARRACTGELVCWMADDCEFPDDVLGKAYRFYKEHCTRKDIVSLLSKENYHTYAFSYPQNHVLRGRGTPLMAMIGLMDREYLDELGGIDRRYICGQYENNITMQVYAAGGKLYPFGDESSYVDINHKDKHGIANGKEERTFAMGYPSDRKVLENSWIKNGVVIKGHPQRDSHEPFDDKDILTKSQSNNLEAIWE